MISLICGFMTLFNPRLAFKIYIILLVLSPTGNWYKEIVSWNGIYFFDLFLIGGIAFFVRCALTKNGNRITGGIFMIFFIVCIWLGFFAVNFLFEGESKYLIKDLRPLLLLCQGAILLQLSREISVIVTWKSFCFVAMCAAFTNLFWFGLFVFSGLNISSDVYYLNNRERYFSSGTFLSLFFVLTYCYCAIKKHFNLNITTNIVFLLSVGNILLSNSRLLILALCICILIISSRRMSLLFKFSVFLTILLAIFYGISFALGVDRIVSAMDFNSILLQVANRFSPAMPHLKEMSGLDLLFGLGPGTFFDIPWFYYRDIDPFNVSIDSTYLTFFVKYGIVGLLFMGTFVYLACCFFVRKEFRIIVSVFLALIFFGEAVPYLPHAIGIYVGVGCAGPFLNKIENLDSL